MGNHATAHTRHMSNTFERYLQALKTSTESAETQLKTSELALQRCRDAIEWQFAVSEQSHMLAAAIQRSVDGLRGTLADAERSRLTQHSLAAKSILQGMQHTSESLGQELQALLAVVTRVERLTADLARHNDDAAAAHRDIARSQTQSN